MGTKTMKTNTNNSEGNTPATSSNSENNTNKNGTANQHGGLKKKYGLLTAICMIVGTVIGSGIFFKSEEIAEAVGGRMYLGVLAWLVGGLIMISLAYSFAVLATRHNKANGFVDYSDALVHKKYGYFVGWFFAVVFYPALMAILAHVSARFTVELFNLHNNGHHPQTSGITFMITAVYLILIYGMNTLGPKIAGYFHVSTTFIKLVPLVLMGIVGFIFGLSSSTTTANINSGFTGTHASPIFAALVATAFAFGGWETPLTMNAEIKNSKRNLPIAMVAGGLIIVAVYMLYFFGMFGALPVEEMGIRGSGATRNAFVNVFGGWGGPALVAFIVVSCLGTCNGLVMASQRTFHSLAKRGDGPFPKLFKSVDPQTNSPVNSGALSLILAAGWLALWGANLQGWIDLPLTRLVIPVANIFLIPILVGMMIRQKDLKWFNRFVAPSIAIASALTLVVASTINEGLTFLWFTLALGGIMGVGALFLIKPKSRKDKSANTSTESEITTAEPLSKTSIK